MAGVLDVAAQHNNEQQQQQRQHRDAGDVSLGSLDGTSADGARGSGGDGGGGGAAVSAPLEPWGWRWVWGGGDTLLVQLGDVLDRGPHSLGLLVLLERLKVGPWVSEWMSLSGKMKTALFKFTQHVRGFAAGSGPCCGRRRAGVTGQPRADECAPRLQVRRPGCKQRTRSQDVRGDALLDSIRELKCLR